MRGAARDGSKHRSDMVRRCQDTLGAGSTRSGGAWVSRRDYRKGLGETTSDFCRSELARENVNDNAYFLNKCGAYGFLASKLAPTKGIGASPLFVLAGAYAATGTWLVCQINTLLTRLSSVSRISRR
ncbi:hypothetical protein DXU77_13570 [Pseudomonas lactis]|nr:hypothetical protein [Pseudomonas lactis]